MDIKLDSFSHTDEGTFITLNLGKELSPLDAINAINAALKKLGLPHLASGGAPVEAPAPSAKPAAKPVATTPAPAPKAAPVAAAPPPPPPAPPAPAAIPAPKAKKPVAAPPPPPPPVEDEEEAESLDDLDGDEGESAAPEGAMSVAEATTFDKVSDLVKHMNTAKGMDANAIKAWCVANAAGVPKLASIEDLESRLGRSLALAKIA